MPSPAPEQESHDFSAGEGLATSLLAEAVRASLSPPPDLTASEWAEQFLVLSPEYAGEPGRWQPNRAAYQLGMLDAFLDPKVTDVSLMTSSQVGKTLILQILLGYHIDLDPCPMLVVLPTETMAETFSKDRLAPMLRDTPRLKGKVADAKTRDSGNTVLHKSFHGGRLTLAGANSPVNLAARPIRIVLLDEIDRFPQSAGAEGDPVDLALKRTTTFWNRKRFKSSTPTTKGVSRIEADFLESDQRFFHVPCPQCGASQRLVFAQVKWRDGDPETARYECEHCRAEWNDALRRDAVAAGEWVSTSPFRGKAGFHLSELYSPWVRLSETVSNFLDAKHSRSIERLRVWTNTSLGEVWDDEGRSVDEHELATHKHEYSAEVPAPVCVLSAGVDVQDDRFEVEVVGWNEHFESWSVAKKTIFGDPGRQDVWKLLDEVLFAEYQHESGLKMKIAATAVDSGGHFTQHVYMYCKPRLGRSVFPIKGMSGWGRPVTSKPSKNNSLKVPLWLLGVDTAKETIAGWLRVEEPGPGYCHFPTKPEYDDEFFKQLCSEKLVTRYSKGKPSRVWKQMRERNDALDARAYAYAALLIRNPQMGKIADSLRRRIAKLQELRIPEEAQEAEALEPIATPEPVEIPEPAPKPDPVLDAWRVRHRRTRQSTNMVRGF